MTPKYTISSELQMLFAACFGTMEVASEAPFDTDRLQTLISYHGIRPQFLTFIHQNNLEISFRSSLTDFHQKTAISNLLSVRQQMQVIQLLADAGVESYAYKGSLWADWLYGDVGKREFGDIDLLIKPDHFEKALDVLETIGYLPDEYRRYLLDKPERKMGFFKTDYHIPLENTSFNASCIVELHWQVAYTRLCFDFPAEEWDQYRVTYYLYKYGINSFQNEYQFLLLLVHHGGKEQWSRIKYIADFAAYMIRHGNSTNWELVEDLAKSKGIYKLYTISIGLLKSLGLAWQKKWPKIIFPTDPKPFINIWESMPVQAVNSSWPYFIHGISVHDGFKYKRKVILSHLKYLSEWRLLGTKMQWYSRNKA